MKATAGARAVVGDGMVAEGCVREAGRPVGYVGTVFMRPWRRRRAGRTGVRAPIVALKGRNGPGAKGRRKVEA